MRGTELSEYSEKEKKLIAYFGYSDIICKITPITMYKMMMEKAFIDNMTGPEVESVRRCNKALKEFSCYRCTPEWDAMIEIGEENDND